MRVQVVWVVRHGEIGDAFFDLDAAQFLLGRRARRGGAGDAAAGSFDAGGCGKPERAGPRPHAPEQAAAPAPGAAQDAVDAARDERSGARGGGGSAEARAPTVLSGRAAGPAAACRERSQLTLSRVRADAGCGTRLAHAPVLRTARLAAPAQPHVTQHGVTISAVCVGMQAGARYGHAVGPRWAQALAADAPAGRLILERDCEVTRVVRAPLRHAAGCPGARREAGCRD